MKILVNVLWIILGGFVLSAFWAVVGLLICLTVFGVPFGIQCFKFANLMLFPFDRKIIYEESKVSLPLSALWIIIFGLNLSLWSLVIGVFWCITIVGIPVGLKVIEFAKLSLIPFGAKIV